jgi:hypothetical protein
MNTRMYLVLIWSIGLILSLSGCGHDDASAIAQTPCTSYKGATVCEQDGSIN